MPQPPFLIDVLQVEPGSGDTLTVSRDSAGGALKFVDALLTSGVLLPSLVGLRNVTGVYIVGRAGDGAPYLRAPVQRWVPMGSRAQAIHSDTDAINALYEEMEAEGQARLRSWFDGAISSVRSADMRYGEQIFEIDVPLDQIDFASPDLLEQIKAAFERRHEALYTYSLKDQDPVLVNARVATVGALPALPEEPLIAAGAATPPTDHRRIYLGEWLEAPVYDFDRLVAGQSIPGPALVVSETTNVLLRHGDQATTTPHGWLDILIPL
ncbi:MAG: hypothetical protein HN732_21075 [Rhodospirillaceae bacterium]|nr:hypothetical protein [Rhodospirillaceae bacterium]